MSSSSTAPILAERGDIHKSCKYIETLLNTLNEYCEAAGSVVSLQKKLAKALKDAASSKAIPEIASNAMLVSSSVFESLSDVDIKFSKALDKEYDTISDEVKKAFKKLTKEEKAHDEKMSFSNAKIKQAGQTYEKKAKKKAIDANEEHIRYINLISTLGPEISQDKYNHTLSMNQRHTTMIYSVASSLARLADLEWLKSCECVRRFSPTIGPLGNLRSLCEGGWVGPIPSDLPDIAPGEGPTLQSETNERLGAIGEVPEHRSASKHQNLPILNDADSLVIPAPILSSPRTTTSGDGLRPPNPLLDGPNTDSVRSLSAFPIPPGHIPFPPPHQQEQIASLSTSNTELPSGSPLVESPISVYDNLPTREVPQTQQSASSQSLAPSTREQNRNEKFATKMQEAKLGHTRPNVPRRSHTALPSELPLPNSVEIRPLNLRSHYDSTTTAGEFGVLGNSPPSPKKNRNMDNFKYPRLIERTDTSTSTTGSIVAAMRSRYDNNSGSTSPRDLPRLPVNVSSMAARYQSNESLFSPTSPPAPRQQSLPIFDVASYQPLDSHKASPNNANEERRRQHEDETTEMSQRQREQKLRDREAELDARARELERERGELRALRTGDEQRDIGYSYENKAGAPLHTRERRMSHYHEIQRPEDLDEEAEEIPSMTFGAQALKSRAPESYNQHLVPPLSPNNLHPHLTTHESIHSQKSSHPPSPLFRNESSLQKFHRSLDDVSSHSYANTSSLDHAPFCGCEKCSMSKYRESHVDLTQSSPTARRSEKSKLGAGWMKRLSIPVNTIKKHSSNNSIGALGNGITGGVSNKGAGLFSLDSKRNMSMTRLGAEEDGKLGPGVAARPRSARPF